MSWTTGSRYIGHCAYYMYGTRSGAFNIPDYREVNKVWHWRPSRRPPPWTSSRCGDSAAWLKVVHRRFTRPVVTDITVHEYCVWERLRPTELCLRHWAIVTGTCHPHSTELNKPCRPSGPHRIVVCLNSWWLTCYYDTWIRQVEGWYTHLPSTERFNPSVIY